MATGMDMNARTVDFHAMDLEIEAGELLLIHGIVRRTGLIMV